MQTPAIHASSRNIVLLLAVVLAVVASTVALPPRADALSAVELHSPSPAPDDVVSAGVVTVAAWARPGDQVATARLFVDDELVDTPVAVDEDPAMGLRLQTVVDLAAGAHQLRLAITDQQGDSAERRWTVSATSLRTTRHAGADRYETSVAVARASYPTAGSATSAVLARGDDFADALSGVPLAAHLDGPLLLSRRDELPGLVAAELDRVLADDATVHLLGGPSALGTQIEGSLDALGLSWVRHAGTDRWGTAAAIGRELPPGDHAFLVSGSTFADALAASVPAARQAAPILLASSQGLPTSTRQALADVRSITIVGGTRAVPQEVEDDLARQWSVRRVAGTDRYSTAVKVATTFPASGSVAIASGSSFADALAGGQHAAMAGASLLLTEARHLSHPTADSLAAMRPDDITVYGGPAAIDSFVVDAAVRAIINEGVGGVHAVVPAIGSTVAYLDDVVVTFEEAVATDDVRLHLEVGGREVPVVVEPGPDDRSVRARLADGSPGPAADVPQPTRLTLALNRGGRSAVGAASFTYVRPGPIYASASGIELFLPSPNVEMIGFHESNHDGSQDQAPRATSTPKIVMETRYRGNGARSAADIVSDPELPIYAPATGTVVRAGTYRLYCDHYDHFLVIEPDAQPGWEVKLLHFKGLSVGVGDRVIGGTTQVGTGPRTLPFESQVDEYSAARNWPHVHVEVVDPSIPDRPGSGC